MEKIIEGIVKVLEANGCTDIAVSEREVDEICKIYFKSIIYPGSTEAKDCILTLEENDFEG